MQRLTDLFHRRWAISLIAELHSNKGAKFVTLVNRLGVSRDSLRQTLDDLIAQGLVMRNSRYGHPMRPEYVLTHEGAMIGPSCVSLLQTLAALRDNGACRRKWSMPVIFVLRGRARRFSELESALPGLTPRALAQTLKELRDRGLIERVLIDEHPPTCVYKITVRGRALARWSLPAVGLPLDSATLGLIGQERVAPPVPRSLRPLSETLNPEVELRAG